MRVWRSGGQHCLRTRPILRLTRFHRASPEILKQLTPADSQILDVALTASGAFDAPVIHDNAFVGRTSQDLALTSSDLYRLRLLAPILRAPTMTGMIEVPRVADSSTVTPLGRAFVAACTPGARSNRSALTADE